MQVNSELALQRGRELRDKFGSWAKVVQAQREVDRRKAAAVADANRHG
jgi:hypothetical protein